MHESERPRWRNTIVSTALAGTVLAAGLAPDALNPAEARKRLSAREVQSFSNATQLGMGDDAPAQTSTISVSGFDTLVADVEVTLININFGAASSQDMDILLLGPQGQSAIVLSDAGGNTATSGATIILDDQATAHLPSTTALTSGTFQPTNYGTPDTFQHPSGGNFTPASGSALGVFNGSNPNGTWQLFAFDDSGNSSTGSITGGWRLRITSANGVPTAGAERFQAQAGKTLSVPAMGVLANDSDPDGDTLTAILAGRPQKGQVSLQADGSFTYRSNKKAKGRDSFTYLAQDPSGLNALATVDIQIKGKKHKKGKGRR